MIYKKVINREIIITIINSLLVSIFVGFLALILGRTIIRYNLRSNYDLGSLVIDVAPRINKKLDKITDLEGILENGNQVLITNNGLEEEKYKLLLCGKKTNNEDIRIGINKSIIRSLVNLSYEDGCYLIDEKVIIGESSKGYFVNMWYKKSSKNNPSRVNYQLKVVKS